MLDWNGYRNELGTRIGELGKLSPDTVRGYSMLSAAGSKTNHLDAKTRELIALAVAVTTRCDGCITVHVDAGSRTAQRARKSRKRSASRSRSMPAPRWCIRRG
jgi:AhpD family alkylhydroperoxidase